MRINNSLIGAAALVALVAGSPARADVSVPYSVKVYPALKVVLTPVKATIHCDARPGTVLSTVSTTGGNGKPVKFSLIAGDITDFALAGANVVVGPRGVAAANCGKVPVVTVSAAQEP